MNLSKVEDPVSEYASKYLQGRQCYILIRVVRKHSTAQPLGQQGSALGEGGLERALFSSHLDTAQKPQGGRSLEEMKLSLCLSRGCSRREGTFPGQNHLPQLQAFSS